MERPMKKILIAAAVTLMCGSAFAQTTTGPAAQTDTSNKPGMSAPTNPGASTSKSTTGMNKNGMSKDNMKKDNMKK
jgi:pentapeptide MXKDX repeat protein